MNNNINNNKEIRLKITSLIILISLFILTIYSFSYGIYFFFTLIINNFIDFSMILSILIIYFLPSIYLLFYFRKIYYSSLNLKRRIIYLIVTTLLLLVAFILVLVNLDKFIIYLDTKFINNVFPIDIYLILISLFFINIYLFKNIFIEDFFYKYIQRHNKILCLKNNDINNNKNNKLNKFNHIMNIILLNVLYVISLIFISTSLFSLFFIENILINPFYFIFINLILYLPFINLIYFIFKNKLNYKYRFKLIFKSILISLNILSIIIFFIIFNINNNFIIEVVKPLFPIDLAGKYPIELSILFLSIIISSLYIIIDIYKDIKLLKSNKISLN